MAEEETAECTDCGQVHETYESVERKLRRRYYFRVAQLIAAVVFTSVMAFFAYGLAGAGLIWGLALTYFTYVNTIPMEQALVEVRQYIAQRDHAHAHAASPEEAEQQIKALSEKTHGQYL